MKAMNFSAHHDEARPSRGRKAQRGFSLLDVTITVSVLAVGLLAQASLTISSFSQTTLNKERRLAMEGVRDQLEVIKAMNLASVFAAYDESTANDLMVAPGPHFDIRGLHPAPGDTDGHVGRVIFPVGAPPGTSESNDPVLREDVSEPFMGMPFDLDGDGAIDSLPKDGKYIHLPVTVEVEWTGKIGRQSMQITTWLTPRE